MNNYYLLSKLKEGQEIKIITKTKEEKENLHTFVVRGNSPLIKKIGLWQKDSPTNEHLVVYENGCFKGFYDFNKELFKNESIEEKKLILNEELNIACTISSYERALELKEEIEKYNDLIKIKKKNIIHKLLKW